MRMMTLASVAAVVLLAFPTAADAQIVISGGIHIGATIPAPPIVVYDYYYTPPPPMVVYAPVPPPPPVVVVRPAPQVIASTPVYVSPEPEFQSEIGLGVRLNGAFTGMDSSSEFGDGAAAMGGGGAFIRFHTFPNFALELGLDGYAGEGYASGSVREEIPAEISALWFFGSPEQAFRLFLLTGFGTSWARIGEGDKTDEPVYVGGIGGIGLEWRLIPSLALEADVRGFIRQRVNDRPTDPAYAFDPMWNDGSCNSAGECTDLEGGGTFHLGAILYF